MLNVKSVITIGFVLFTLIEGCNPVKKYNIDDIEYIIHQNYYQSQKTQLVYVEIDFVRNGTSNTLTVFGVCDYDSLHSMRIKCLKAGIEHIKQNKEGKAIFIQ